MDTLRRVIAATLLTPPPCRCLFCEKNLPPVHAMHHLCEECLADVVYDALTDHFAYGEGVDHGSIQKENQDHHNKS